MIQRLFLLVFFAVSITACESGARKNPSPGSRLVPEPDIVERLKYEKMLIDSQYNHNKKNIVALEKLAGQEALIRPAAIDSTPDSLEAFYYVLKNDAGLVTSIAEYPYSESGDWFMTLTHYFGKNGKTFAFERHLNFFGSGCTPGVAYETKTEFYDDDFRLISKAYKLVDQKGNNLVKDSCSSFYDDSTRIFPNVDLYMKANKIKINR